ncbi:MAG: 2-amino-4-hydroxy-6-hydroxymethyldihydropteridine diphosphokinase [Thermodesulfobacteriota bacterium]
MNDSERVFIGIGSNKGSRRDNYRKAVLGLREAPAIEVVRESPLYETSPWGLLGQRPFINAAVEVRTTLGPIGLLACLKALEKKLGRGRGRRWGPRVIDLDILFFGRRLIDLSMLTVPHPRLHERAFALVPLLDLAPEFIHPLFNESMMGIAGRLTGRHGVKRVILEDL